METGAHRGHEKLLVGGTALLSFLLLWQAAVSLHLIDPLFVSSPARIWQAGRGLLDDPDFWRDVRVSATEFAAGYGAAICAGRSARAGDRLVPARAVHVWTVHRRA